VILVLVAAAALQPQAILTIDPAHRLVEGVATDGRTIFVSSVLDRQVLTCRKACRTLATLPPGLHPFALAWDRHVKRLWVAADCPPDVPGIKACDRGALIGFDTRGHVRTRITPEAGTFHPGDVSTSGGRVFVSDSQNGMVFRLLPNGKAIMAVNLPGGGKSAQGTALTPDGQSLIVADYSLGIGSIDIKTAATTWLPHQEGRPLRGIDGLVRCGDHYLGIYNGGAIPARIWSFRLRPGGIDRSELAEGMTLTDPTQIAYDGRRLLLVSDSGWERVAKGETSRRAGAQILSIPLSRDCKPL
jgi:hypothetical protein